MSVFHIDNTHTIESINTLKSHGGECFFQESETKLDKEMITCLKDKKLTSAHHCQTEIHL